jgi:hypothetical protein
MAERRTGEATGAETSGREKVRVKVGYTIM